MVNFKMTDLTTISSFTIGLAFGFILRSRWALIRKFIYKEKNSIKSAPNEAVKNEPEPVDVSFL